MCSACGTMESWTSGLPGTAMHPVAASLRMGGRGGAPSGGPMSGRVRPLSGGPTSGRRGPMSSVPMCGSDRRADGMRRRPGAGRCHRPVPWSDRPQGLQRSRRALLDHLLLDLLLLDRQLGLLLLDR